MARQEQSTMGRLYPLLVSIQFRHSIIVTMAAMDVSKAGRGGLTGALSAMDGAKRGPQERLLPPPANPPRPANPQPCSC